MAAPDAPAINYLIGGRVVLVAHGYSTLEQIARELPNGRVSKDGDHVRWAGPDHSAKDDSVCVWLHKDDGIITTHSHADDQPKGQEWVGQRLGVSRLQTKSNANGKAKPKPRRKAESKAPKQFSDQHLTRAGYHFVEAYPYHDADRVLRYQKLRYEHPTEKKQFPQRRPDGKDGWFGDAGDVRLPYAMLRMRAAVHNTVLWNEGEKAAGALNARGFVATCSSNGHAEEIAHHFRRLGSLCDRR
jgi:hypothetical protein